ncbi:MAG: glycerol-3-phosphate 1-O-acyltransferase PlsY [Blautia sp.]|nr:glycerol-3-phosphate 1-O-acyltransferase PlsY [Blautia sp.]
MERIFCLIIGYVFGLFNTGYIIGRIKKTDIREHGSGNAGTTNALRTFGLKIGLLTLLGDCMKCVLAVLVTKAVFGSRCGDILPLLSVYTAAGCILGHNYPFTLGFKGGKGIAATLGMFLAIDWPLAITGFAFFLIVFFVTHYVSLASLSANLMAFVSLVILGCHGRYGMDTPHRVELYVVMGLLTALAFYRHKENIRRLARGEESKVYLKKKNRQ